MPLKLWEQLTEGIAGVWNTRLLAPAAFFWVGGIAAWCWKYGWQPVINFLETIKPVQGIAIALVIVFALGASASLSQLMTLPILQLTEGYWPSFVSRLRKKIIKRLKHQLESKRNQWKILAYKKLKKEALEEKEEEEYTLLDKELAQYPLNYRLLMPTLIGNILRAAEEYPLVRYGLEITVVWPRLWLILPELARQEVSSARQALDERTRLMVWGLVFIIWSVWAWWALPIGLLSAFISYRAMISSAGIYGELLRSSFDLYRHDLYSALKRPIPKTFEDELETGEKLTKYLFRGS